MSKFRAVEIEGEVKIHLPNPSGTGEFYTLCGLDGDEAHPVLRQKSAPVPKGARVNCHDCYQIWKLAQEFERVDFEAELQKWAE